MNPLARHTPDALPAPRPERVKATPRGEPSSAELREVVSRLGEQVEELRARLPVIRDGQTLMQEMVETLRWVKEWAKRVEGRLPK